MAWEYECILIGKAIIFTKAIKVECIGDSQFVVSISAHVGFPLLPSLQERVALPTLVVRILIWSIIRV